MLVGISTACLYGLPLRYAFRLAAECGFDGVELAMCPEALIRGPRRISALARAYGLTVASVHVALVPPSPLRSAGTGLVMATRMALALGARSIVFHGPFSRWHTPRAQAWLAALAGCREAVEGSETRLAIENAGLYAHKDYFDVLGPIPVLCAFAERYDLSLTLDTCHVGNDGLGLLATYAAMSPRLTNIHLSDYARSLVLSGLSVHSWRHGLYAEHQFPGEGDLPLRPFLASLARDGYAGSLNLEIGPLALRAWSPRQTRERLRQAREFLAAA